MKTLKASIFFVLTTFSLASLQAQTVDEIVSKHINAIGGKDVLNSVKTIYIESSVDIMGQEAPTTTYILNGKGYKYEMNFNGQTIQQCITDKGGWSINPMTGQTKASALPDEQVKASQAQLQVGGPLFNYADKGNKAELIGKDTAGGATNYKIRLTPKEGGFETTYYIDATTYYITKAVSKFNVNGQEGETTAAFSDYKKTDIGLVMPYSQQLILPQITLNITNKKIEVNKTIDPAIFEMPK